MTIEYRQPVLGYLLRGRDRSIGPVSRKNTLPGFAAMLVQTYRCAFEIPRENGLIKTTKS